ncbi:hypothetical protein ABZP36_030049 [Zizania latifolia]
MDAVSKSTTGCGADPAPRPPRTQKPSDERVPSSEAEQAGGELLQQACSACLRLAVLVVATFVFAQTALSTRSDPWELAFVVTAYGTLAVLFGVLRRAELLTPASPAWERRRLLFAAWALSTALSCAFAYRIARIMPFAMAVAVWAMTASVVAGGFYLLVLNGGRVSEDCHVDDGGSSFQKIPAHEMV